MYVCVHVLQRCRRTSAWSRAEGLRGGARRRAQHDDQFGPVGGVVPRWRGAARRRSGIVAAVRTPVPLRSASSDSLSISSPRTDSSSARLRHGIDLRRADVGFAAAAVEDYDLMLMPSGRMPHLRNVERPLVVTNRRRPPEKFETLARSSARIPSSSVRHVSARAAACESPGNAAAISRAIVNGSSSVGPASIIWRACSRTA